MDRNKAKTRAAQTNPPFSGGKTTNSSERQAAEWKNHSFDMLLFFHSTGRFY